MKLACALGDVELALKSDASKPAGVEDLRIFRRLLWEALREIGRTQRQTKLMAPMRREDRAGRLAGIARQYTPDVCERTERLNETLPVVEL